MINGNACFAYFNKSWGIPICSEGTPLKVEKSKNHTFLPYLQIMRGEIV